MRILRTRKRLVALGALVVVSAWVVFRMHYARWTIPQEGMSPSFPAGAGLWVRKGAYDSPAEVNRGDVIVFQRQRADGQIDFVWRVVGLPRDKIAIRGDRLVVNGLPVTVEQLSDYGNVRVFREHLGDRSYSIAIAPDGNEGSAEFQEVEVPDGYFFVLGDNRHHAADSRTSGPVAFEEIIGRVDW